MAKDPKGCTSTKGASPFCLRLSSNFFPLPAPPRLHHPLVLLPAQVVAALHLPPKWQCCQGPQQPGAPRHLRNMEVDTKRLDHLRTPQSLKNAILGCHRNFGEEWASCGNTKGKDEKKPD